MARITTQDRRNVLYHKFLILQNIIKYINGRNVRDFVNFCFSRKFLHEKFLVSWKVSSCSMAFDRRLRWDKLKEGIRKSPTCLIIVKNEGWDQCCRSDNSIEYTTQVSSLCGPPCIVVIEKNDEWNGLPTILAINNGNFRPWFFERFVNSNINTLSKRMLVDQIRPNKIKDLLWQKENISFHMNKVQRNMYSS